MMLVGVGSPPQSGPPSGVVDLDLRPRAKVRDETCHKEGALTAHFGVRAAVSVKDIKIYWIYNNAKRTGSYKEKSVFGTSWSDAHIKDVCRIAGGQNREGLAHSMVAKYSNTCIETTRDSCYPFLPSFSFATFPCATIASRTVLVSHIYPSTHTHTNSRAPQAIGKQHMR
ncbi:hypothetical protein DFJ73DRAFT_766173 [Zopfochytrium polystomum]|nr:hypothetical protein DFJ73DRAFT_766173 [Zopfochytrium polystomum]